MRNFQKMFNTGSCIPPFVVHMPDDKEGACRGPCGTPEGLCNLEAIVSVDDRGQILLPKELRAKANIRSGEKLAVLTCVDDGEVSVIALVRSSSISGMIGDFLKPKLDSIG